MDYKELKKSLAPWKPVYALEFALPRRFRRVAKTVLFPLSLIVLAAATAAFFSLLHVAYGKLAGLCLIFFSLWLVFFLLDCFYYSYYFKHSKEAGRFAFELALVVLGSPDDDIIYGFMFSNLGKKILWRCGIDRESQRDFLSNRKFRLSGDKFKLPEGRSTFRAYLEGLIASDAEFKNFILA